MRALIISNCATSAYTKTLQLLRPDWDVRGVNINLAQQWLADGSKPEFLEFYDGADFLVSVAPDIRRTAAHVIKIPGFFFRGLHPDSFHLNGTPSILDPGGNLQSRIAAVAYLLGKSPEDALSYFHEGIFESAGYAGVYESEKALTIKLFADEGISIQDLFQQWEASGNFLHQYNHPKVRVLVDIFLRAIEKAIPHDWPALEVGDELAKMTIWPVYPGIGRHLGVQGSLRWRRSIAFDCEELSLTEFVSRSYDQFRSKANFESSSVPGFAAVASLL